MEEIIKQLTTETVEEKTLIFAGRWSERSRFYAFVDSEPHIVNIAGREVTTYLIKAQCKNCSSIEFGARIVARVTSSPLNTVVEVTKIIGVEEEEYDPSSPAPQVVRLLLTAFTADEEMRYVLAVAVDLTKYQRTKNVEESKFRILISGAALTQLSNFVDAKAVIVRGIVTTGNGAVMRRAEVLSVVNK